MKQKRQCNQMPHLSAPGEAAHRAAVVHGEARHPDIRHRLYLQSFVFSENMGLGLSNNAE